MGKKLWVLGLVLVAVGECATTFDGTKGGNISETYRDFPRPVKFLILVAVGAVLGHWEWPMPLEG